MNGALGAGAAVVVVLAAAIVFVLVTDGGDDEVDLSQVDLSEALLTLEDMEDDSWEPMPELDDPPPPDYVDDPACQPMFDILETDEGENQEEASFQSGSLRVIHYVESLEERPPGAEAADLAEAVAACEEYTYTFGDPLEQAEVVQQVQATDQVGDASVAYGRHFTFVAPDGSEEFGTTFRFGWERDGVYSSILYMDIEPDGSEGLDYLQPESEGLAVMADERLQELLEDA